MKLLERIKTDRASEALRTSMKERNGNKPFMLSSVWYFIVQLSVNGSICCIARQDLGSFEDIVLLELKSLYDGNVGRA